MNFAFQPSESNDMMHYAKGSQKSGAKYISRKLVNGKWIYKYAKKTVNNFKEGYAKGYTNDDGSTTLYENSEKLREKANKHKQNRFGGRSVGGMDRYDADKWDINDDLIRNEQISKEEKAKISKSQRMASKYVEDSKKEYNKAVDQWTSKSYKLGKTIGKTKKKLKK